MKQVNHKKKYFDVTHQPKLYQSRRSLRRQFWDNVMFTVD